MRRLQDCRILLPRASAGALAGPQGSLQSCTQGGGRRPVTHRTGARHGRRRSQGGADAWTRAAAPACGGDLKPQPALSIVLSHNASRHPLVAGPSAGESGGPARSGGAAELAVDDVAAALSAPPSGPAPPAARRCCVSAPPLRAAASRAPPPIRVCCALQAGLSQPSLLALRLRRLRGRCHVSS
jgi:hypothetical protein